jgi:hypothetical protein
MRDNIRRQTENPEIRSTISPQPPVEPRSNAICLDCTFTNHRRSLVCFLAFWSGDCCTCSRQFLALLHRPRMTPKDVCW